MSPRLNRSIDRSIDHAFIRSCARTSRSISNNKSLIRLTPTRTAHMSTRTQALHLVVTECLYAILYCNVDEHAPRCCSPHSARSTHRSSLDCTPHGTCLTARCLRTRSAAVVPRTCISFISARHSNRIGSDRIGPTRLETSQCRPHFSICLLESTPPQPPPPPPLSSP